MNIRIGRVAGDEQWAPVSDLMAGLMLVFMFIAIIFIRTVVNAQAAQQEECDKIYWALKTNLGDDFENWDVKLLKDLTIRFRNPEILFQSGMDDIPDRFKRILSDFFPRYMKIVRSDEYRDDIREIRIEGHTSSVWRGARNGLDAYFKNMELSQSRTREILEFVLGLPNSEEYANWAKDHITANGLSSSRLICGDGQICRNGGVEDEARSRRVEFKLLTESCSRAGAYDLAKEMQDG